MSFFSSLGRYLVLTLCLALFLGCDIGSNHPPNVLVIAVDSLRHDDIRCSAKLNPKGSFQRLCEEFIKFTHTYTTSTLAVPAVSSLLTGRYPFATEVWNNGRSRLSEQELTVAELAHQRGFFTTFFSGGPPIWSHSGLNQGFRVFDDTVNVNSGDFFVPVKKLVNQFSTVHASSSNSPFLSFVYLADLQFADALTYTSNGRQRPRNFSGQLEEIDVQIGQLMRFLRESNLWNSTYIVFVGLNGRAHDNKADFGRPASIFSENTRVTLFIKPNRKKRDRGLRWNVDSNVSLADVGQTLIELFQEKKPSDTVSLHNAVTKMESKTLNDRMIHIESGWPTWHGFGTSVFASRKNHLMYLFNPKNTLFNSLIDLEENSEIVAQDPAAVSFVTEAESFWLEKGVERFTTIKKPVIDKLELAASFFKDKEQYLLGRPIAWAIFRSTKDQEALNWLAHLAIKFEDWKTLKQVALNFNDNDLLQIARVNLGEIDSVKINVDDENVRKLKVWMDQGTPQAKRERAREQFIREQKVLNIRRQVEIKNLSNYMVWFKNSDSVLRPLSSDIYLSLPENRVRREITQSRVLN